MNNREVTLAVCGVVVGIILGSVSSTFASPMQGDLFARAGAYIPFHNAPDAEDYTRRKVDEKGLQIFDNEGAIPDYPTVRPAASESSSSVMLDMSSCGMVKRAIAKVRAAYDKVIPVNNIRYTDIRVRLEAAFTDALSECMTAATVTTTSSSSAAKTMVDNNCEKYPVRSIRYSQCTLFEKEGKKFP